MIIDVLDRFLPIIQKHYPNTLKDSIVFYDDGHDHYVFVVNHTHAFRIPRTEAYGKNDQVENVFLKQLTKTSPIKVQIMTGQVDKYTGIQYQTYEFIPGIRLSRELAATLTQEELVLIAKDIARFLIHLHSFPIEQAKEMKMDTLISAQDYGQYFKSDLERNKAVIFPILTQEERRWIEQLVIDFVALTEKNPFELKVIHSDMLPEHIIIDEKSHLLNGVIDFSPRIADPANDFKFFNRYGQIFLKTVYDNYLPVDEFFDKRRKFYAGNLPVANLYQSIERNDKKMINLHLAQLKEYISTHTEK